jgi:hypothetical protein
MRKPIAFSLATLLGIPLEARAVNLHGKVLDKQGKAVANAIVTLTPQGWADTTGADGGYAISNTTSIAPGAFAGRQGASLRGGVLQVVLENPAPLAVAVFDTRGTRLSAERLERAPAGVYRWDIGKSAPGNQVLWIKASFGNETKAFRHARLLEGDGDGNAASAGAALAKPSVSLASASGALAKPSGARTGGGLAKAAADPESLRVTAQ